MFLNDIIYLNLFASFIVYFAPAGGGSGYSFPGWTKEAAESFFMKNLKCFFFFCRHSSCRSLFCAMRLFTSLKSSPCCTSSFLHLFCSSSHVSWFSSCFSCSSSFFLWQFFMFFFSNFLFLHIVVCFLYFVMDVQ